MPFSEFIANDDDDGQMQYEENLMPPRQIFKNAQKTSVCFIKII